MASRISHLWSVVNSTVLILIITILQSAQPAQAQCQYEVTIIQAPDCPPFGAQPTVATGINNLGHVVGYYDVCLGDTQQAFLWTPEGGMQTLDMPNGVLSARAHDINDAGQIVGTMGGFVTPRRGFLYDEGEVTDLGTLPGGNFSEAEAINEQAQVAGYWGNNVIGPIHGFIWGDGVMTDLGPSLMAYASQAYDINDSGQVTGWRREEFGSERIAFRWHDGDVTDLGPIPGGISSDGRGISNLGEVTGFGVLVDPKTKQTVRHALFASESQMIDIGVLPGMNWSLARDVNDLGMVVGTSSLSNQNHTAFLWHDGNLVELNDVIPPDLDVFVENAMAINNSGWITGQGSLQAEAIAVILIPVEFPLGDLSGDCRVSAFDLALLLGSWGACPACPADLDSDGNVNALDLALLLGNWT